MKKVICSIITSICLLTGTALAQIALNPQIGATFTSLSIEPRASLGFNVETDGKLGVLFGADLRIGGKLYVQPGLFVIGSKVRYSATGLGSEEVTRYGAKVKGLLGYKILDLPGVKLRVMGGPTYDAQLSFDSDGIFLNKDDFKQGIFNLDAAVGVDVFFLTAELGYSWAFTETFDTSFFQNKPRYRIIYFTVGMVFGN